MPKNTTNKENKGDASPPPKRRGRPPKKAAEQIAEPIAKKGRGRPRKSAPHVAPTVREASPEMEGDDGPVKRKVGEPPSSRMPSVTPNSSGRDHSMSSQVSRASSVVKEVQKRKRGRPKKVQRKKSEPDEDVEEADEVESESETPDPPVKRGRQRNAGGREVLIEPEPESEENEVKIKEEEPDQETIPEAKLSNPVEHQEKGNVFNEEAQSSVVSETPKRKRGRPKKDASLKKPPKAPKALADPSGKRGRGRPPKIGRVVKQEEPDEEPIDVEKIDEEPEVIVVPDVQQVVEIEEEPDVPDVQQELEIEEEPYFQELPDEQPVSSPVTLSDTLDKVFDEKPKSNENVETKNQGSPADQFPKKILATPEASEKDSDSEDEVDDEQEEEEDDENGRRDSDSEDGDDDYGNGEANGETGEESGDNEEDRGDGSDRNSEDGKERDYHQESPGSSPVYADFDSCKRSFSKSKSGDFSTVPLFYDQMQRHWSILAVTLRSKMLVAYKKTLQGLVTGRFSSLQPITELVPNFPEALVTHHENLYGLLCQSSGAYPFKNHEGTNLISRYCLADSNQIGAQIMLECLIKGIVSFDVTAELQLCENIQQYVRIGIKDIIGEAAAQLPKDRHVITSAELSESLTARLLC